MKNNLDNHEELKKSSIIGKWSIYISGLVIVFALFSIGLIFYWLNFPAEPLVIKNNPVPVNRKEVKSKEPLFIHIDYCKNTKAKGIIMFQLVTEFRVIILPAQTDTSGKVCQMVDYPIIMPDDLHASKAHLEWEVHYKLNPVRQATVKWQSQEFLIVD